METSELSTLIPPQQKLKIPLQSRSNCPTPPKKSSKHIFYSNNDSFNSFTSRKNSGNESDNLPLRNSSMNDHPKSVRFSPESSVLKISAKTPSICTAKDTSYLMVKEIFPKSATKSYNILESSEELPSKCDSSEKITDNIQNSHPVTLNSFNKTQVSERGTMKSASKSLNSSVASALQIIHESKNEIKVNQRKELRKRNTYSARLNMQESKIISEQTDSENCSPDQLTLRSSIHNSLKEYHKVKIVDFPQALTTFNNCEIINIERSEKIWKESLWKRLCCCFRPEEISDSHYETLEKLVLFACSAISYDDIFHKNLLASAYAILHNLSVLPRDFSEKLKSPSIALPELAINSKVLPLALLNILFLDCYFPSSLSSAIANCIEKQLSLIQIISDLTEATVKLIKKKKLNDLISRSGKCLELIFFFFAGLFLYYFGLKQIDDSHCKSIKDFSRKACKNLQGIVTLAKSSISTQSTNGSV